MLIVHRVVLCVRVLSECFMFSQFVTPPPAPRSRGPASASTCTDHVILCVLQLFGDLRTNVRYVDQRIRMPAMVAETQTDVSINAPVGRKRGLTKTVVVIDGVVLIFTMRKPNGVIYSPESWMFCDQHNSN